MMHRVLASGNRELQVKFFKNKFGLGIKMKIDILLWESLIIVCVCVSEGELCVPEGERMQHTTSA